MTYNSAHLPPPPQSSAAYSYPPIIVILTIILLIFFFFGFFAIYFCRCFMENILCAWHLHHGPSGAPVGSADSSAPALGLDPLVVQSFPTFTYSTVKEYRKEKYGLECAICLVEFQGSDILRLLTTCYHVFHQECIDLWLESHKTCPVCRRNLESQSQSPVKSPSLAGVHENENDMPDSISITVKDESDEDERVKSGDKVCSGNDNDDEESKVEKFTRSHSTGHSLIKNKEKEKEKEKEDEEDRYKLILPEHVKSDIIRAHHNSSQSCPTFGEIKVDESDTRNINGLTEASGLSGGESKV